MIDVRTLDKLIDHFKSVRKSKRACAENLSGTIHAIENVKIAMIDETISMLYLHKNQSKNIHPGHKFVPAWEGAIVDESEISFPVKAISWKTTDKPRSTILESYIKIIWKGFSIPQRNKITKASIKIV